MAFGLALRMALLLLSGVLAPAVLTGKGAPLALLPPASKDQGAPWARFSNALGRQPFPGHGVAIAVTLRGTPMRQMAATGMTASRVGG